MQRRQFSQRAKPKCKATLRRRTWYSLRRLQMRRASTLNRLNHTNRGRDRPLVLLAWSNRARKETFQQLHRCQWSCRRCWRINGNWLIAVTKRLSGPCWWIIERRWIGRWRKGLRDFTQPTPQPRLSRERGSWAQRETEKKIKSKSKQMVKRKRINLRSLQTSRRRQPSISRSWKLLLGKTLLWRRGSQRTWAKYRSKRMAE